MAAIAAFICSDNDQNQRRCVTMYGWRVSAAQKHAKCAFLSKTIPQGLNEHDQGFITDDNSVDDSLWAATRPCVTSLIYKMSFDVVVQNCRNEEL